MTEAPRILIVEDEPLIARNLEMILTAESYLVVGIVYDPKDVFSHIKHSKPDLVLLDINLNGEFEGLAIGMKLKDEYRLPFIFITSYADEAIINKAKLCKPGGYIVKPFDAVGIFATLEVAWYNHNNKGGKNLTLKDINKDLINPLTNKEFEILLELGNGKAYQEIAQEHFISINTVSTHIKSIYSKLDIHSRSEAILFISKLIR